MIERARLRRILLLALPIVVGMLSQNLVNLVDLAMVAPLGDTAIAAVGQGGFVLYMCLGLTMGISTGVQAVVARRKGAGHLADAAEPLNAGLLMVVVFAPAWTVLLYFAIPALYPFLNDDPAVLTAGVPYLQLRVLAITCIGANLAFRGYWNALDMSRAYMWSLVVMHVSNIAMNWIFIYGKLGAPAMGVAGAGLASTLAAVVGLAFSLVIGWNSARAHGFLARRPDRLTFDSVLRVSLPSGIQQVFLAAGATALFAVVGRIGTAELAAASVLINLGFVAILPGLALGIAAATLVGQALGAGDPADARRWGWDVAKVGAVGLGLLGLPMVLMPHAILSVFVHDPQTLAIAVWPLVLGGASMPLEAVGLVVMYALLGAGDARRVMMTSIAFQWLLFLPLAFLLGPFLGGGLFVVWLLQTGYRVSQGFVLTVFWRGDGWVRAV